MAYPTVTVLTNQVSATTLTTDLPNVAEEFQTFGLLSTEGWSEVDANGVPNGVPLGQSGPFVLTIGSEDVLCVSCAEGIVTVFNDAGTNGRAYNSTTIADHIASTKVTLKSTSVQSSFAPLASPVFTGVVTAPAYAAGGLTGSTAASRYVGATAAGAPALGTFAVGDFVVDQTGAIWICSVAGSPGTWVSSTATSTVNVVRRSATATAGLGEATEFIGAIAAQTITLPVGPSAGSVYQFVNDSSVNVSILGGTNSINIGGVVTGAATPIVVPVGQAYRFIFDGTGVWTEFGGVPDPNYYSVTTYGATGNGTTDDTAAIQAAINAAETAVGAVVLFPPGTYKTSSVLTVDLNRCSIVGTGSAGVKIQPTSALVSDVIRVTPVTFSITVQAGVLSGFTVDGTNAGTGAVGIHYGDLIGGRWDDVVVQNFAGTSQVGIHMDNVTHWTERTVWGSVFTNNCTTHVLFDVNGGTVSFGYTHIHDLSMTVASGQVGLKIQAAASIYNAVVNTRGNINGGVGNTAKWVWITGSSLITHALGNITGEQTTGTGATALQVDAGSTLSLTGVVELSTFTGDTLAGTVYLGGWVNTPAYGWGGGGTPFAVQGGPAHFSGQINGAGNIVASGSLISTFGVQPGNNTTPGANLWSGSGVPAAGLGVNGDYYFRTDTPGTANQRLYVKSVGAWVGIL